MKQFFMNICLNELLQALARGYDWRLIGFSQTAEEDFG